MRLGYLVLAHNGCTCEVVEKIPEGTVVNLGDKTWTYRYAHHHQPEPIGHGRYVGTRRGGVIGVYDLDDLNQVNSMVRDAVDSQKDWSDAD